MGWNAKIAELESERLWKFALYRNTSRQLLTFAEVVELWTNDTEFALWLTALLAEHPSAAFRFETPVITRETADRTFEFVLVDSPALEGISADLSPFARPLAAADAQASVVTFSNLSGDAEMVVPRPTGDGTTYPHLAAFARSAPQQQQAELWREVSLALRNCWSQRPVWLNTAGLGVSWLHVRLDSRPKYYAYRPYKAPRE